ncbi:MAG: hypothetical protein GOU99_00090 [Candidatus Altiarchaeota archaeon]|nr:hypothetical protein [Candidatus Altiarchaeota archaeon]
MSWKRFIKVRTVIFSIILLWSVFQLKPWAELNLDWGFDIQGGVRVILQPENQSVPMDDLVVVVQNRLNIYGLKDIRVRSASDLQSSYLVVEAAGLSPEDVESLLASQGFFEGKIDNITVFTSGDVRVDKARKVLRYDKASGIYEYEVPVMLSPEAAKKFAEITANLIPVGYNGTYLNATLDLFIDGKIQNSLQISSGMKGKEIPIAQVTGGAQTYDEAKQNSDFLTAILMTGAIPTTMEIVSMQRVSPTLGAEFLRSTSFAGIIAAALVGLVIFIRYKSPVITSAILFTALSELLITMSIASFINWELDLSAIAGLIITLGTGVNQQIIMTDELKLGKTKKRIKDAMFIILASFATIFSTMLPLMWIGIGSVRGFAVTTIIGVVIGYFITRPAYLAFIEEVM